MSRKPICPITNKNDFMNYGTSGICPSQLYNNPVIIERKNNNIAKQNNIISLNKDKSLFCFGSFNKYNVDSNNVDPNCYKFKSNTYNPRYGYYDIPSISNGSLTKSVYRNLDYYNDLDKILKYNWYNFNPKIS